MYTLTIGFGYLLWDATWDATRLWGLGAWGSGWRFRPLAAPEAPAQLAAANEFPS